ncbi:MAG: hypothetical protein JSV88_13655, partial [Candidatus Aminicenantes bacterium]
KDSGGGREAAGVHQRSFFVLLCPLLVFLARIFTTVIPGAQVSASKNGPLGPSWAAGAARFVADLIFFKNLFDKNNFFS